MHDAIEVTGLAVDCIIGVRPDERLQEQPVEVDLSMSLDTSRAGRSGRISDTVDYDRIATAVAALLRFRRYQLIEAAVEEISAMLFGVSALLEAVRVRLSKPRGLGSRARGAAVAIERTRLAYPRRSEATKFGEVEILLETRAAGLYLLHVEQGREIPMHYHRVMRELEWVVQGTLTQDGEVVPPFVPVTWPRGKPHAYYNRSEHRGTLFCCDSPPFIPDDEIETRKAHGDE